MSIPNGVKNIGDYAFYFMDGYYSLMSIAIPSSVTSIGEFAIGFYDPPNDEAKGAENIPGFVIYGESGSAAETYAKENGFDFVQESGEPSKPTPPAKKFPQTLKVTKNYSKTFGSRNFKLNASLSAGDGALTYISSNTKVVTVDKTSGTVSVKGCGIATITVNAAETAKYAAASASIAITVSPAKLKTPSVKAQTGKKLKAGKKYYVRVRAYVTVKTNGTTQKLAGAWSNKKMAAIKQ